MASDAVKKAQQKLFRGGNNSNNDGLPRSKPALTINIPAVPSTPRPPAAAPPKSTKVSDPSPDNAELDARQQQDDCSYRKHLVHWKHWGPYLSDCRWATVRKDYLANGDAWSHFPHEHTRSRAYRWGKDSNHGEDVKELYYYLDSTPSHSYVEFLYKYPQRRYPYKELVTENRNRSCDIAGYEILDLDTFNEDRYQDVFIEYAKDEDKPDNVYIGITAYN
ncbi:hypothetical protein C8R41DRAFT_892896 [Lentinula lateritia]|uniref:Uncharacterized protein n=1 Tax=Lentinula lateritia TaxID=40482 RepID=A0ABQ8W0R0_9AGAR|nr:hypothetical protein C8R41DRAFT_892896 [Lentinula lateritia]